MVTVHVKTQIGPDGRVRLDVPCSLPPGPAEVVVTIEPDRAPTAKLDWMQLRGLGKEIWKGMDGQTFVDRLRDE